MPMPHRKYRPYDTVDLPDRTWPGVVLSRAPIWCSTDLRDGNQALVNPMDAARKRRFFDLLLALGFKEIEVGFPAASATDFEFVRTLVEEDLIPDDVTIAVLTQARPELIERTFEALEGARARDRPPLQLDVGDAAAGRLPARPGRDHRARGARDGALQAARGARRRRRSSSSTRPRASTTPSSTTRSRSARRSPPSGARRRDAKMIVNLPTTVEHFPPNVYADRMEWFCRNFSRRDAAILSVHPHNDRGTAVATAELGLMAGAERVEGTLFGNGERTGNVDIVTIALNLLTQGVDPGLDLSRIDETKAIVEECNELPVHPRHPWAGELVYTAFSGSHQDAIKKGMHAQERAGSEMWDVPYLPIDPKDLGRNYEAIIRVNSQSGKGGVAYLLQSEYGLDLPRGLQVEFAQKVQAITDAEGGELTAPRAVRGRSARTTSTSASRWSSSAYRHESDEAGDRLDARVRVNGEELEVEGAGNGPIAAFVDAVGERLGVDGARARVPRARAEAGEDATAAAYVEADVDDEAVWGVGIHASIVTASLRAVVNSVNRALALRAAQAAALEAFGSV